MKIRLITVVTSVVLLLGVFASPLALSASSSEMIAAGKKIAFNKKKGNCISCHMITGGQAAGNVGPPLLAMKARFPDKKALRSQIWDSTAKNKSSVMPPFGRHNILTEKEIDLVSEFVHSL